MFQTYTPSLTNKSKQNLITQNSSKLGNSKVKRFLSAMGKDSLSLAVTAKKQKTDSIKTSQTAESETKLLNLNDLSILDGCIYSRLEIEANYSLKLLEDIDSASSKDFSELNEESPWQYPGAPFDYLSDFEMSETAHRYMSEQLLWGSASNGAGANKIERLRGDLEKWQGAFIDCFAAYSKKYMCEFYVIGSTSGPFLGSSFPSIYFCYGSSDSIPYAIIVGATRTQLERFLSLGVVPIVFDDVSEKDAQTLSISDIMERLSVPINMRKSISTSGQVAQSRQGKGAMVSGLAAVRAAAQIMIDIMLCHYTDSRSKKSSSPPTIVSSQRFKYAIKRNCLIKRVPVKTDGNNHTERVALEGILLPGDIMRVLDLLISLSYAEDSSKSAEDQEDTLCYSMCERLINQQESYSQVRKAAIPAESAVSVNGGSTEKFLANPIKILYIDGPIKTTISVEEPSINTTNTSKMSDDAKYVYVRLNRLNPQNNLFCYASTNAISDGESYPKLWNSREIKFIKWSEDIQKSSLSTSALGGINSKRTKSKHPLLEDSTTVEVRYHNNVFKLMMPLKSSKLEIEDLE